MSYQQYNDEVSISQIIGNVFNHADTILDNTDKYHLTKEDFPVQFH